MMRKTHMSFCLVGMVTLATTCGASKLHSNRPPAAAGNAAAELRPKESDLGPETLGAESPGDSRIDNRAAAVNSDEKATATETYNYSLPSGYRLQVKGTMASICDQSGAIRARNERLIRLRDEHGICMSEGFITVIVRADGFILEQQNCSGWYFINEMLQFRVSAKDADAHLEKFSLTYFDRRAPEKEPQVHTRTAKDFGSIRFIEVELQRLYDLIFQQTPADAKSRGRRDDAARSE